MYENGWCENTDESQSFYFLSAKNIFYDTSEEKKIV